jgi:hypothetical protein
MVNTLIASIKEKKEFNPLPENYIEGYLAQYFKENPDIKKKLAESNYNERSALYKETVKSIRAKLREVYGVFQKTSIQKRQELLDQFIAARGRGERLATYEKLMSSHQSTFERKEHYKAIYHALFLHHIPQHILDLGCGMNPLAHHHIPGRPEYTCCDISTEEMAFVQKFFDEEKIKGKAFALNLLDTKEREQLMHIPADTVLLFKLVDTLESQERNVSKTIIKELFSNSHVEVIIVSFALQSISGKQMRTGNKENWFSSFLRREEYLFTTVEIGGEEFYFIRKKEEEI